MLFYFVYYEWIVRDRDRKVYTKVSSAGSENYIIFHNNDGWNREVEIFFFSPSAR